MVMMMRMIMTRRMSTYFNELAWEVWVRRVSFSNAILLVKCWFKIQSMSQNAGTINRQLDQSMLKILHIFFWKEIFMRMSKCKTRAGGDPNQKTKFKIQENQKSKSTSVVLILALKNNFKELHISWVWFPTTLRWKYWDSRWQMSFGNSQGGLFASDWAVPDRTANREGFKSSQLVCVLQSAPFIDVVIFTNRNFIASPTKCQFRSPRGGMKILPTRRTKLRSTL